MSCCLFQDTGEPGWWKGELNGKEGVFPDNFAVQIQESDKDFPVSSQVCCLVPQKSIDENARNKTSQHTMSLKILLQLWQVLTLSCIAISKKICLCLNFSNIKLRHAFQD